MKYFIVIIVSFLSFSCGFTESDNANIKDRFLENKPEFEKLVSNQLLKEKNLELQIAKEKAEKASQARAEFLSTVRHELRTPLNAINGITHLLLEEVFRRGFGGLAGGYASAATRDFAFQSRDALFQFMLRKGRDILAQNNVGQFLARLKIVQVHRLAPRLRLV